MLKKTIKYTDYNGVERTEDFYFNFTKTELTKLETSKEGGLAESINKIINSVDVSKMVDTFETIILKAYGEKSDDGKYFNKSEEISERFSHTEAFNILFLELINDPEKAGEFIISVMPSDVQGQIKDKLNETNPANK